MDFVWDGVHFRRNREYEINLTPKNKEFIKCGYFKEVIEEKEFKEPKKTKELKVSKKTK